jgi:hypothetical protein
MKLWPRFRRRCRQCEYDANRFKVSGAHMILSTHLHSAKVLGFDALIFGVPDDLPDDVRKVALSKCLPDDTYSIPDIDTSSFSTPEFQAACDASVQIKSSVGLASVPCICRQGSEFISVVGVPVHCFIALFVAVSERLVCLNSSPTNPQPIKYIEFWWHDQDPDERHFAEVELWLDSGNSLRIEIKSFRVEPASIRMSRYVSGE